MRNPFRYFKTSPEIIRLAVMIDLLPVGVIALVGDQVARACCAVEQQACGLHVRDMARRQLEGVGPPERVGEGVDLGRLAAARETDRLIFRPPFPPSAERCALT